MDTVQFFGALRNTAYGALVLLLVWAFAPEATRQILVGLSALAIMVAGVMVFHLIFYYLTGRHKREDFDTFYSKMWRQS